MAKSRSSAVIDANPEQTQTELAPAQMIQQALLNHDGYQDAVQRLKSVESARARLQAEFDQVQSQTQNPDLERLASKVISGEEISRETTDLVSRRDALKTQLEAHHLAVVRQQQEVARQRNMAAELVSESLRPMHRQAVADLMKAFDDLQAAHARMVELRSAVNNSGISFDSSFVFWGLDQLQQQLIAIAYERKAHWNNWVSQNLEG